MDWPPGHSPRGPLRPPPRTARSPPRQRLPRLHSRSCGPRPKPSSRQGSAVEAGDWGAVFDGGAVERLRVEGVGDGAAGGLAGALRHAFAVRFLVRGLAAAALDREVADAVAGVDHVVAGGGDRTLPSGAAGAGVDHVVPAVADEDVLSGLAEHAVGAAVADQDVPVEGALHVLVGA